MGLSPELIRSLSRLSLPNPPQAAAGWVLDRKTIDNALDYLAIKLPVVIAFKPYKRHKHSGFTTWGRHYAEPDHHKIHLNTGINDDSKMNVVLLHELVHAIQAEEFAARTGEPQNRFYRLAYMKMRGPHGASYEENYYEIQARDWSVRIAEEISPLIHYE